MQRFNIQALRRIQRFAKSGLQQLSMFPFNSDIWCSNDAYLYFLLVNGMIVSCICVDTPFLGTVSYRLRQFENDIPVDEILLGSIFSIVSDV